MNSDLIINHWEQFSPLYIVIASMFLVVLAYRQIKNRNDFYKNQISLVHKKLDVVVNGTYYKGDNFNYMISYHSYDFEGEKYPYPVLRIILKSKKTGFYYRSVFYVKHEFYTRLVESKFERIKFSHIEKITTKKAMDLISRDKDLLVKEFGKEIKDA